MANLNCISYVYFRKKFFDVLCLEFCKSEFSSRLKTNTLFNYRLKTLLQDNSGYQKSLSITGKDEHISNSYFWTLLALFIISSVRFLLRGKKKQCFHRELPRDEEMENTH